MASEFEDDADIRSLFNRMMTTPRGEYEAAMPSLADMLGMVRRVRDERIWTAKREARLKREADEAAELERRRREEPESFVTLGEVMQDWARKQGPIAQACATPRPIPPPVQFTEAEMAAWPAKVRELYQATREVA